MRITGGELRGRKIKAPDTSVSGFRPTMDFIRESMFSSLGSYTSFNEKRVLDLFAGSGMLSFESLSRGASHVVAVEEDLACCKSITENAQNLQILGKLEVVRSRVEKYKFNEQQFDIVFADPPYESRNIFEFYKFLVDKKTFSVDSFFVFEDRAQVVSRIVAEFSGQTEGGLVMLKSKMHGDSGFIIFKVKQN